MAFLKLFISCAVLFSSVVLAQSNSNNTLLQIEAIEAHFANAQLVPTPIPAFTPTAILTANFSGVGNITPGQLLNQNLVQSTPSLSLTPANASVTFAGRYTVAMIDPGAINSGQINSVRHWLVNNATISGGNVDIAAGIQVTSFNGPAPPPGSGPHRYTIVIYSQPDTFTAPADLSQAGVPLATNFDFPGYVQSTGLGPLVAGIYFTVENGTTASFSIQPTSSVITSTLPAFSSTSRSPSSSGSSAKPSSTSGAMSHSVAITSLISAAALLGFVLL